MLLSTAATSSQNTVNMLIIQAAGRNIDDIWLVKDLHKPWLKDLQEYMGGWISLELHPTAEHLLAINGPRNN